MKILLIIPAYNEENCITKVIDELVERYPQYDYIIVMMVQQTIPLKFVIKMDMKL